ncbi:hypothetical protein BH18THE2_BH18THE2_22240 [soil metagenome]
MLTIIRCNDSFVEKEILEKARANLSQFPNLNFIFNNFASFSFNNSHNKNTVFRICIRGDSNSIDYLKRLENALSNLIAQKKLVIRTDGQDNTKFIKRMTSNDPWDFSSVISEIFIADYLLSIFGPNSFQYEEGKRSERKPDFTINANNRQYSLELRTLMKGKTEEKIESIFDEVCIHILNLLKEKCSTCNIIIRIDTSKLCINQEKQIDVERSRKYLLSYFNKLNILNLIKSKISIDFEYLRRLVPIEGSPSDRKASKALENIPYHTIFTFDENDSPLQPSNISEWLDKIAIKDLVLCPFDSIGITKNQDTSCVSISPIDVYFEGKHSSVPGAAASEMNKKAFIDQIKGALGAKGNREQWKRGHPAIIVLDTYNWHFEFFEYEGFLSLRKPIEEELKKYPDISGAILFHEIIFGKEHYEFYDGRYIQNKDCKSSLRVTAEELQEAHIIRRYNDPLITYDKKVDFQSLDDKQQVHRLMDLINLESNLTWEDDKIELLKTIELFLCKNGADKELITKLEPLIRKYCNDPNANGVDASVIVGKVDLGPLTPISIRALAASCQLKITKHNPTAENINFSVKLYDDSNTLIREAVCSNLKFLSEADFEAALKIAKQILDDNWRVRFHLGKYLQYITKEHEEEALELIKEIVEKFKIQDPQAREKDTALEIGLRILTHKALRLKAPEFKNYLKIILNDLSYPDDVKKIIAYTCKEDKLLFNKNLFDTVLEVYIKLIEHPSVKVYEYASFHLFYNIKQRGEPYYEKMKPVLDILSRKSYEPSFPFCKSANMILYLRAFCRQIPVEDTIHFLERLCHSHPFLVNERSESWKVLEILECLTKDKVTTQSSEKIKPLILKLVKSGTPTAENLLTKIDDKL